MTDTQALEVLRPSDASYDEIRRIHNGLIDKRPSLIARCRTTTDVAAAVDLGRSEDLEISVRGGGHNVAGTALTDGGLMIDLSAMKDVAVDGTARIAQAEPGVTWDGFNLATAAHGLATTGGVMSTTGIAGLTLGGGYGWLQGKYGLAIDNLTSVEVVTANGSVVRASEEVNADLFWALRGGGGNFGVVTSFTFRLHPVSTVFGGLIGYPVAAAEEVLDAYRRVTKAAPDELTVQCGLSTAPDGSTRMVAVPLCHCGELAQAETDVRPLRELGAPLLDELGPLPYVEQNRLSDEMLPRGALNYWKSAFFRELSDAAIATLLECFEQVPSAMTLCVIEAMGGAAARVAPTATAYPHREPGYSLLILAQWSEPADTPDNIAWARDTFEALRPHMADRRYMNYMSADDGGYVHDAYGPNYERLVEIKQVYDPDNLFHLNQNIPPR
jgi:FAD/FMN-containing dehydrogenase